MHFKYSAAKTIERLGTNILYTGKKVTNKRFKMASNSSICFASGGKVVVPSRQGAIVLAAEVISDMNFDVEQLRKDFVTEVTPMQEKINLLNEKVQLIDKRINDLSAITIQEDVLAIKQNTGEKLAAQIAKQEKHLQEQMYNNALLVERSNNLETVVTKLEQSNQKLQEQNTKMELELKQQSEKLEQAIDKNISLEQSMHDILQSIASKFAETEEKIAEVQQKSNTNAQRCLQANMDDITHRFIFCEEAIEDLRSQSKRQKKSNSNADKLATMEETLNSHIEKLATLIKAKTTPDE